MLSDLEEIRRVLPDYAIYEEIGSGSFGSVLEARHERLDRRVAIKRLAGALGNDPEVRRRFVTEAKILSTLDHPHIVSVFDFVERDGNCLLIMELLTGGSLHERRYTERLTIADVLAISLATCSGLQAAHQAGVLHRDIKPANLLFAGSGALKIVDFGIAKMIGGAESLATITGTVLGSLSYMAPEQVLGDPVSAATDVYGLATVLYETLAGRFPFDGGADPLGMLAARVQHEPLPLTDVVDVPPPIAGVVMRGLTRYAADRYQTADAFGVALARSALDAFGPGWLRDLTTTVYATGELSEAIGPGLTGNRLDASRAQETASISAVALAELMAETAPPPAGAPASDSASLLPVHELMAHALMPGSAIDDTPSVFRSRLQLRGADGLRSVVLLDRSLVVGREAAGLTVADDEMSRWHSRFTPTGAGVAVSDLQSSNGTFVNGEVVAGTAVAAPGDDIRMGNTRFVVLDVEGGPRVRVDRVRVLTTIVQGAISLVGADLGWLIDYVPGGAGVLAIAGSPHPEMAGTSIVDDGLAWFVANAVRPVVSPPVPGDPAPIDASQWQLGGVRVAARLSVPCVFENQVVALLEVGTFDRRALDGYVPALLALSTVAGAVVGTSRT